MTSNIGAQEILADLESRDRTGGDRVRVSGGEDIFGTGSGDGEISETTKNAVEQLLHQHFRPEFLNRLDEIIMFKPLTKENIGGIVELLMKDLNKRLAEQQISIRLTDEARDYCIEQAYDPVYGARPLKRYLQQNVETLAAKIILRSEIHEGSTIIIDRDEHGLTGRVSEAIIVEEE
jgi:ATP-dependent Clp protease ATP-binding subunit ClpB